MIYIVGYLCLQTAQKFNGVKDKSDCAMLQQDLNTIHNLAIKWEMSFSATKCKVMHIRKQLGTDPCEYVINGQKP